MSDRTYNGWANYETWLVNVWMTNDDCSQRYWDLIARSHHGRSARNARCKLANRLKYELGQVPDDLSGFHKDMLNAALCEVDWNELASHMLADVEVEDEDQATV